jgi:hypothetical protein
MMDRRAWLKIAGELQNFTQWCLSKSCSGTSNNCAYPPVGIVVHEMEMRSRSRTFRAIHAEEKSHYEDVCIVSETEMRCHRSVEGETRGSVSASTACVGKRCEPLRYQIQSTPTQSDLGRWMWIDTGQPSCRGESCNSAEPRMMRYGSVSQLGYAPVRFESRDCSPASGVKRPP